MGQAFEAVSSWIGGSSLVILLKFDEKFLTVLLYLLTSLLGTCVDQKLFLLYILYYFMMN